jgi:luciferase family oxidoreductase group 1
MKLSIVDQSPVSAGMTSAQALNNTVELARLADRLGYSRYWIAEHHAMTSLASPAPEILVARIGAETSRIRIGSGGVMLPHYAPLKVAEQFRMLHALYPGRIDLGLGRAPGGTPLEAAALRRNRETAQTDDFPQQLIELLAFLEKRFPDGHPFGRIHVSPDMPGGPEVWLLGSSLWSAMAAAEVGLPYAFAHFFSPGPTREAFRIYRTSFRPSPRQAQPYGILAIGVICADSDDEAQRLALPVRLLQQRIRRGIIEPVARPEEAEAALAELPPGPDLEAGEWPRYVVGTPEGVHARLLEIALALSVDEIMAVAITHDHAARLRSYELLAEAFGLTGR